MTFFAHTAEDEDGRRLSDEGRWRPRQDSLCVFSLSASTGELIPGQSPFNDSDWFRKDDDRKRRELYTLALAA